MLNVIPCRCRTGLSALSSSDGCDHGTNSDDVDRAPKVVGERGQAELRPHILEPLHQEGTLAHPLLDGAERVFDRLTAAVNDVWPVFQASSHPVQHGLVLQT